MDQGLEGTARVICRLRSLIWMIRYGRQWRKHKRLVLCVKCSADNILKYVSYFFQEILFWENIINLSSSELA